MGKESKKANPFYLTTAWKHKRQEILARDHYECVKCRDEGKTTTMADSILDIDHILELKEYPELAMDNENLQTLCRYHHNKKHGKIYGGKQKEKNPLINNEWFGE